MPGSDLSQPASRTAPSNRSACMTHSTESAMTSRLTSEARIPSCPIAIPSDTEIVPNCSGKPPAAWTPSLAFLASRSSDRLHGVISFHDEAIADLRLDEVLVAQADGPQHGPRGRPFVPAGHLVAAGLTFPGCIHSGHLTTMASDVQGGESSPGRRVSVAG